MTVKTGEGWVGKGNGEAGWVPWEEGAMPLEEGTGNDDGGSVGCKGSGGGRDGKGGEHQSGDKGNTSEWRSWGSKKKSHEDSNKEANRSSWAATVVKVGTVVKASSKMTWNWGKMC